MQWVPNAETALLQNTSDSIMQHGAWSMGILKAIPFGLCPHDSQVSQRMPRMKRCAADGPGTTRWFRCVCCLQDMDQPRHFGNLCHEDESEFWMATEGQDGCILHLCVCPGFGCNACSTLQWRVVGSAFHSDRENVALFHPHSPDTEMT